MIEHKQEIIIRDTANSSITSGLEWLWMPYYQGRINHCAGCTMGGGPCRQGGAAKEAQSTAKFLPRCFDVWTFII